MKIKTVLITLSLSSITFVNAQEVFKVMINKGHNQIQRNGTWSNIKTGDVINSPDVVKVINGGFLGLIHKSGKTIELKTASQVIASEISKKVEATNTNVHQKYGNFVYGEMTKAENSDITKNHKANMKVTGSVDRALAKVTPYLPKDSLNLLSESVNFRWTKAEFEDSKSIKKINKIIYVAQIINEYDEVILSKKTTDTSITLNLADLKLNENSIMLFRVCIEEDEADLNSQDKRSIHLFGLKETSTIRADIKSLKDLLGDDNSSMNCLILANYVEKRNLFTDAMVYYEKAIKLAPDVEDYHIAYKDFVHRWGLKSLYDTAKK